MMQKCVLRMAGATQDSIRMLSSWVQFNRVSWWGKKIPGAEEGCIFLGQKNGREHHQHSTYMYVLSCSVMSDSLRNFGLSP